MAKTQVKPDQIDPSALYADSYSATGQAAAGEFTTTTRKTYDVSSIPTGRMFLVYSKNQAADGAGLRNVTTGITYNGVGYGQDTMTQYHQSVAITVPLIKVAGQNSVIVGYGGSAASQAWQTTLNQMN